MARNTPITHSVAPLAPATITEPGNVRALTTEELHAELARSLEVTARHLTHLAKIWRELERRGEDLSHLRSGLWAYMPLIGSERLRPEIVVKYAGHSMLLRRLADLSLEDQDRLLSDNTVVVVDHKDGQWSERHTDLTHLRASEIAQVFGDKIRTTEEQRRFAMSRSLAAARTKPGDIKSIVASIPSRRSDAVASPLTMRLSAAQQAALNAKATELGVSPARLAVAALISTGIIPSA